MRFFTQFISSVSIISLFPLLAWSGIPQVRNLKVLVDTETKRFLINYDLENDTEDAIKVVFKVSYDGGRSFFDHSAEANGHVGFPVSSGTNRQITWNYEPSLSNEARELNEYRISISATDFSITGPREMIARVDENKLRDGVEGMVGERNFSDAAGLKGIEVTRTLIEKSFRESGYKVLLNQFRYDTYNGINYIGLRPGDADTTKLIVICAHYDTVFGSPGADDNASGVSVMLEISRVIASYSFKYSILFVAFDLEEEGLLGSQYFVNKYLDKMQIEVLGVINLDMVGYYNKRRNSQNVPPTFAQQFPDLARRVKRNKYRADFVITTANAQSAALSETFAIAAKTYTPRMKFLSIVAPGNGQDFQDLRQSDHASFWDREYTTISVGDGADTRNKFYHTKMDTLDKLDFTIITRVARAVLATIATIAEPTGYSHAFATFTLK